MKTKKYRMGPATRLEIGALVLMAALQVDTKLIKGRLKAFAALQRRYAGAQHTVETLEAQLRTFHARLAQHAIEQHEAVKVLACVLAIDGQPRINPFAAFGTQTPRSLKKLPLAEQAAAIDQLVAAVQRANTVSQSSCDAALKMQKAARVVEADLAHSAAVNSRLETARLRRNAIGERWDKTYGALKHSTRAAADDGGAHLHAALFGRLKQSKSKNNTAGVTTAPAAPAAPTAVPSVTAA